MNVCISEVERSLLKDTEDYDNKQKDVSEFLSLLLHRIDKCISHHIKSSNILDTDSFKSELLLPLEGQLINRVYPKMKITNQSGSNNDEENNLIERTERFFYISLNVSGFSSITESLEDFTKEDSLQFAWSSNSGIIQINYLAAYGLLKCALLFSNLTSYIILAGMYF